MADEPGLYNADPSPNPDAPAFIYVLIFSGVIPPTGSTGKGLGSTALMALKTSGGALSAGKSLSASAPRLIAAKASVGVAIPGIVINPPSFAAVITLGLHSVPLLIWR